MYKIVVFAGTTEGRTVAEFLDAHGMEARICVATEYGESLLPQGENLTISHERLSEEEMEALIGGLENGLVIDATHPYAKEVTANIKEACEKTHMEYLRVLRQEAGLQKTDMEQKSIPIQYVETTEEAVTYLDQETEGSILVTTGSKELAAYTRIRNYQERIYARTLSLPAVAASCAELGIQGKHLICMQGPFSLEMNKALIRQFGISWMVTKESGKTGGFWEKYQAAVECGCGLVIIGRPLQEQGYTLEETLQLLAGRYQLSVSEQTEEAAETEQKKQRISLVGIGMGTPETLTREAYQTIREAQLVIGAGRMLEQIIQPGQETFRSYKPEEICDYILEHPKMRRVVVALSGDVGFYSGAKKLLDTFHRRIDDAEIQVYPGISSMIYFLAKLETAWEDVYPVSLHGRERNLVGLLQHHPKIFAIVGTASGVGELCRKLTGYGMGDVKVAVGERLSYPDQKITKGTAASLVDLITDPLSVVLLEWNGGDGVITHGIPDDAFTRAKVPMTKEEVRSISLSKLRLKKDSVIYDVGAGTGSVSIEMALQAVDGKVYAVEKKEEAVTLLGVNKEKFRTDNLVIVPGLAPEALEDLPVPTHGFIGGSSGNLRQIMELLLAKNPKVRMVINAITLETVAEAMDCIRNLPVEDVDIAQVNVAKGKKAGPYHLMMGQNPVYVIACTGTGE